MSTTAAPVMTFNTAANALSSQSLAVGATVTFDLDVSAKFEVQVQIKHTFPNVAPTATTGLRVRVFKKGGTTPDIDTQPMFQFTIPSTQNATEYLSIHLPTGKYRIELKDTDTTSAVTVAATADTVDSVVSV